MSTGFHPFPANGATDRHFRLCHPVVECFDPAISAMPAKGAVGLMRTRLQQQSLPNPSVGEKLPPFAEGDASE